MNTRYGWAVARARTPRSSAAPRPRSAAARPLSSTPRPRSAAALAMPAVALTAIAALALTG